MFKLQPIDLDYYKSGFFIVTTILALIVAIIASKKMGKKERWSKWMD